MTRKPYPSDLLAIDRLKIYGEKSPARSLNFGAGKALSAQCNGRVPEVMLPKSSLVAAELALIVNEQDPQSIAVTNYYQRRRRIPPENVNHIRLQPGLNEIERSTFQVIKSKIDAALSPKIQAIALSFSQPFQVGCMSITTAFAVGYGQVFCQQPRVKGCRYPSPIPY